MKFTPGIMAVSKVTAGGAALLIDEVNGFAADFLYDADPTKRVAVKASSVVTEYAENNFIANSGTSPKQVWDVAGTLVWSPHNMVAYSQELDNAWWTKTRTSVTANAIAAPDGTLTTDKVVEDSTASNSHMITRATGITIVTGEQYTFSVYAKAAERTWIIVGDTLVATGAAWFNLSAGTVGTRQASNDRAAITALADGWYRCEVEYTSTGATLRPTVWLSTNDNIVNYTGDNTSGVYLWGAQLVRGSAALTYFPTTTAARYGLALDYDPVTHAAKGLLLEPAGTNLLVQSSDFNTSWVKSSTIATNATTAPDGTMTADKLLEQAATGFHEIRQTIAATTGIFSVYAKAGEVSRVMLYDLTAAKGNGFNLSDGTIFNAAGVTTTGGAIIQNVGNGWYRCAIPVTATTNVRIYLHNGTGHSYAGDGVSGVYLWGAQLETGAVATSPIPTFAASATRAADNYNFLLSTIPALGAEYSLYNQFSTPTPDSARHSVVMNAGAATEYVAIRTASSFFVQIIVIDDTVSQAGVSLGALSANVKTKVAARFKLNDVAGSRDGGAVSADTVATVPTSTLTETRFGTNGSSAGAFAVFNIQQLSIVPRAWNDVELQAKTT